MDVEQIKLIILAEGNGMLLFLLTFYAIFFFRRIEQAKRRDLRITSAFFGLTSLVLMLLYLADFLTCVPAFKTFYDTHRAFDINCNYIVMSLWIITLSLFTKRKEFTPKWVSAHLFPFVAITIVALWFGNNKAFILFMGIISGIYTIVSMTLITIAAIRYQKGVENEYSSTYGRSFTWMITIPVMITLLGFSYVLYLYYSGPASLALYQFLSVFTWTTIFSRAAGMVSQRNKIDLDLDRLDMEMLHEIETRRKEEEEEEEEEEVNENEINYFRLMLKQRCEEEKLYLKEDLTRDELASVMLTNHTYLTKRLQEAVGCNFYTYINGLRVRHAQEMMLAHPEWSMDRVAFESGFRNRPTFYNAFRRALNITPTEWREEHCAAPEES